MLTKRVQVAGKIESVEGTAETLAGVDAILAINPTFKPTTPMNKRDNVTSSLSPFASVPGSRSAVIEFDCELKGSGTAGTPPEYGKFLKACGFAETISAGTSVTYAPATANVSSATLALYIDGVRKLIFGARGNVSLKLYSGEIGLLHFTFTGADYNITDQAMLTSGLAYQTTKPPAIINVTFTIDSLAAILSKIDINMNNVIKIREAMSKASGYYSAVITDREASLSLDPELVTVATYDWYGKLRSGNEGALSAVIGATAGNIITVTSPKVQYTGINPGNRNNLATLGIDCQLNRNTGDDEISIAFT